MTGTAVVRWYKRDPDAAIAGMVGLTLEERGAYNIIIDAFYARDGQLPDDDWLMSRIAGCNPRTWHRLKLALFQKRKVTVTAGQLVPNRGEYTLNEARNFSELQANRARNRWEQTEKANEINESDMPSGNAKTTTTTTTKKESDSCAVADATRTNRDQKFEEFWKAYPRRHGANPKSPARKAFTALVKAGVDPDAIIAGARRCASRDREKIGTPYIPQAIKWLRDRRWEDYAADPPKSAADAELWAYHTRGNGNARS